jgi:hypothetical protein
MPAMNSAQALHSLLTQLHASGTSITKAWESVLDVKWGSAEFDRRHAESVGLFGDTLRVATSLEPRAHARYLKYADSWWEALIASGSNWTQAPASKLIEESNLDHLAALGDLLAARLPDTAANPMESEVEDLRTFCMSWVENLGNFKSLSLPLKRMLAADLQHVVWLIDNVGLFGSAAVANASQTAATSVANAVPHVQDLDERSKWVVGATDLVLRVGRFTTATTLAFGLTLQGSAYAFEQLNNNIDQVADVVDGPEAPQHVDAPKVKDLSGRRSHCSHGPA